MPGWNGKRIATYGLISALAVANIGLQVGCHRHTMPDDTLQPPIMSYYQPSDTAVTKTLPYVMLATAGEPYTSVAPYAQAVIVENSVQSLTTSGFTFTVSPSLPSPFTLAPSTGVISTSSTPETPLASATYYITASNGAGSSTPFPVSLGVQAASPISISIPGTTAMSVAAGAFMTLSEPVTSGFQVGEVNTGFGVSPALPAGLAVGASTGVISGTPAAAFPLTVFTLTVTTPTGSANATFTLMAVNATSTTPAPPVDLAYPALPDATTGTAYTSPAPTVAGAAVVPAQALFFTVTPALPAGLSLDLLTGVISGTPTATASGPYTITAQNANGTISTPVSLTVNS